jgi:hypothetical protein
MDLTMDLDELNAAEKYQLAMAATLASVDRLKKLVRWSDPHDEALHAFLQSLLRDEERRADALEQSREGRGLLGPSRLRHADIERLLKGFFPSFHKRVGEGPIDRERGMYLAECLEEESARFYRGLAERSADDFSRKLFVRLEREDDSFLRLVRDVLLRQGS